MPRKKDDVALKSLEFSRIPPEAESWRKVLGLGQRVKFYKGAIIQCGEQSGESIFFLESGEIRLLRSTLEGREKILWAIGPDTLFGETPFFDQLPARSVQFAATDCVVYAFSRKCVFEKILPNEPVLMMAMFRSLASKVRVLCNQSASLCLDDLASRICKFLHLRLDNQGIREKVPYVCPGLNQQDLANLLGVHRVTLNKALRELEKARIISPYSRDEVYILDMKRFRNVAVQNE